MPSIRTVWISPELIFGVGDGGFVPPTPKYAFSVDGGRTWIPYDGAIEPKEAEERRAGESD